MLQQHIEHDFQQQIANLKHDKLFRSAKINSMKNQNSEDLDPLIALKKKEK